MRHFTHVILCLGLIGLSLGNVIAQRGTSRFLPGSFKPYSGEALNVFDLREKKQEGSTFWSDEWLSGAVKMKNGRVLEGHLLRYDIANESVDLHTVTDVKAIPIKDVAEFTLIDIKGAHRFVDAPSYFGLNTQGSGGFFEILVEDEVSLLAKTDLEIQKGNYVAALDAGAATDRVIKKEVYYLMDGTDLVLLPKNKKKRMSVLEEYLEDLDLILKEEKLSLKKERDLITLVSLINKLPNE